jgi:hypothetical protein
MPRQRLRSIDVARSCENLNQCYALGRSKYFCNNIGTSRTSGDVRLESEKRSKDGIIGLPAC